MAELQEEDHEEWEAATTVKNTPTGTKTHAQSVLLCYKLTLPARASEKCPQSNKGRMTRLNAVLLTLVAAFLLTFGEASGLKVGLFADPAHTNQNVEEPVDSYEGYEGGGALMARLLEEGGHTVSTVDALEDEEAWSQVLSSVSVFVFPAVKEGEVKASPFFPQALSQALNTFMEEGGVILWSSSSVLCNQTFLLGWTEPVVESGFNIPKTENLTGTPFETAPETLEALPDTEFVHMGTFDDEVCYYTAEGHCTVMSVQRGEGHLIFLGWDFVSFDPEIPPLTPKRELITSNWETVFAIAVEGFAKEEPESSSSSSGEDGSASSNSSSDGEEDGDGSAANTLRPAFF
ncbi:hypothetical protein QOT17_023150 [Balamuthia mandrillaris]